MSVAPVLIAIDGLAASGKGTLAKKLAEVLGISYLNTGALYRAAAFYLLDKDIDVKDIPSLQKVIREINFENIDELDLYNSQIGSMSSKIAVIHEVRSSLFDIQRSFPMGKKGAVVEGRDIGTVIFPDAKLKFFITADVRVRATRRFKQLQNSGENIIYDEVLRDLKERDLRDKTRLDAPCLAADDSVILDTTDLDSGSALNIMLKKVKEKYSI